MDGGLNNIPFVVYHNIGLYLINPMHNNRDETIPVDASSTICKEECEDDATDMGGTPLVRLHGVNGIDMLSGVKPENIKPYPIPVQDAHTASTKKDETCNSEHTTITQVMPDCPNIIPVSETTTPNACCIIM